MESWPSNFGTPNRDLARCVRQKRLGIGLYVVETSKAGQTKGDMEIRPSLHSNHEQGEEIGPGHNFGSAGGHFGKALWETNVG